MKTRIVSFLLVLSFALTLLPLLRAQTGTPTPTTTSTAAPRAISSSCIDDVLKLAHSGVDKSVMLAYVQNSSIACSLNADDVLRLRDEGVPSEIIAELLRHSGELRAQAARTPNVAPPQVTTTAETAYPPTYSSTPPSVVYVNSGYPDYGYSYPNYGYWYWYNNWYYPTYFPIYFTVGTQFRHDRFHGDHGHFGVPVHNGFSQPAHFNTAPFHAGVGSMPRMGSTPATRFNSAPMMNTRTMNTPMTGAGIGGRAGGFGRR